MSAYTKHKSWLLEDGEGPQGDEFDGNPNSIQLVARDLFFNQCMERAVIVEESGLEKDIKRFEHSLKAYNNIMNKRLGWKS